MKHIIMVLMLAVLLSAVPALYAGDYVGELPLSGTWEALVAFWAGEAPPRPEPGPKFVYSENFVVHFDTIGEHATTRAYAESVAVYAEHCWRIQIDSLGWAPPPSDSGRGGDDRYDIYLRDIEPSHIRGQTYPELLHTDPYPYGYSSYILTALLLDATGRKVMELTPGENNVRHLAPGVYFVREASGVMRDASSVHKVIIQR